MKKMILVGRSESGKTTLSQAFPGNGKEYRKTQYINFNDYIIDTPGEYAQENSLARALALYSYEAEIVGMVLSATEQYSLYPPCCAATTNREVIGIVTQIDRKDAQPEKAENWLRLAGCKTVFKVSSVTGEGMDKLLNYLKEGEPDENSCDKRSES